MKEKFEAWRRWRFANTVLDKVTTIALVLIMVFGFYSIYDSLYVYGFTSDSLAYFFEGGKEDWEKLPDNAIGWLRVDDTKINYPVMQGKDNEEYLNKDAFGKYSLLGSIFMDWRNNSDWKDHYNLLYGHHMEGSKMFGGLDKFKKKDYFDSHKKGTLKTRGADYELTIFAVMKSSSETKEVFNVGSDESPELMNYIKKNAIFYEEPKDKKILAMSTCQSAAATTRLMVFASMKVTHEPGTLYDTDNIVEPSKDKGKK